MRIGRPLLKLPVRFCGDTLAKEIATLPAEAWLEHPEKFDGNIAVPLVSPGGAISDELAGPMAPTRWLKTCPYILDIMRSLNSTWGRSRLMGLAAGATVPEHVDINYYWRTHLRLHIPIVTNPAVGFTCDGKTVHMEAGECWLLDSFYRHSVENRGSETRIHLVLDTVGSGPFWDLIDAALSEAAEERFLPPGSGSDGPIAFEQINSPLVMSPWEMKTHVAYIAEWTDPQAGRDEIFRIVDRFVMAWEGTWARYGISDEATPIYARHLNEVQRALSAAWRRPIPMRNSMGLLEAIAGFILANALSPTMLQRARMSVRPATPFRATA